MSESVEQSEELIEMIEEHLDEQHLKLGIVDIDDIHSNVDDKTIESASKPNQFQYQLVKQQSPAIAVRTDEHEQHLLSDDEMKELTTLKAVPTKQSKDESLGIDQTVIARQQLECLSKSIDESLGDDQTVIARQQLESLSKYKRKVRKSAETSSENEQPQSESSVASRIHVLSSVIISTPNPSKKTQNGVEQTPNRPIPNETIPGTIEIPKELILGNADISSPLIYTTDADASRTLQNEDLIAILEGGDDETPVTFDSNAVSDVLRPTVSTVASTEKPTPSSATAAKVSSPMPKTPIGPLTKDLERRIAMEQMMALPGKRQGRKQKLVAKEGNDTLKKSIASDLVSSLVSEWSDNESKSDTNDIAVAVDDQPSSSVVASKKPPKTIAEPPAAATTNKKLLNAASMPTATFKRSRIIKKKIIWDPDAPETAISYASLVSSSSQPVKKRPKIEKETPQPSPSPAQPSAKSTVFVVKQKSLPSAVSSQQSPKSTVVVVKQKPSGNVVAKSDAPKKDKREPTVKSMAKKRASSDSPSSMNRRKRITEVDRLLGDEGAVNMLNALKQENNGNEAAVGDMSDTESISSETRSSKVNSAAATIVINEKLEVHQAKGKQRTVSAPKQSPAKKEPPATKKRNPKKKTSAASSWDYIYSGSCDDSMIIRRRSNSSYSSTTSPIRLSVELTPTTTTPKGKLSMSGSGSKTSPKTAKVTKEKFEFAKPNAKKVSKDKRTAIVDHSIVNDLSESHSDGNDTMARRSKRGHLPTHIVVEEEADNSVGASSTADVLIKLEHNCYEELLLKRHRHFVEILLAPESNKNENVLTITVSTRFAFLRISVCVGEIS